MSEIRNTFEQAVAVANNKGWEVVEAGPRELFVDIDDKRDFEVFKKTFDVLQEILVREGNLGRARWASRPSVSGKAGHRHVTVTLPRPVADEKERLLFQALLGSDRMREALNLKRVMAGETRVTLFFEKGSGPDELL